MFVNNLTFFTLNGLYDYSALYNEFEYLFVFELKNTEKYPKIILNNYTDSLSFIKINAKK